jgi:hypothetical protein
MHYGKQNQQNQQFNPAAVNLTGTAWCGPACQACPAMASAQADGLGGGRSTLTPTRLGGVVMANKPTEETNAAESQSGYDKRVDLRRMPSQDHERQCRYEGDATDPQSNTRISPPCEAEEASYQSKPHPCVDGQNSCKYDPPPYFAPVHSRSSSGTAAGTGLSLRG